MRALLAAALAVLCAAPALAQTPLFTPTNGTQRLALSPTQSQFLTALESERGIEAVDLVTANARQLDAKTTLELALPDVTVTLEAISATPRQTGHLSWVGRSATGSDASAWAVLVERDGQITGEVHTGGYVYPVRPLTGGLHAVARKSMAEYQTHPDGYDAFVEANEGRIAAEREVDRAVLRPPPRRAGVVTTVDVIVPYTTNVGAAYADPFALAQSFVDVTNTAYDNSGLTDLELRLVNAYETPFASSGSLSTDLEDIAGTSDGTMDEVHTRRTAYGADLVALISGTNTSGVCGIAYVDASSTSAFSANSAGCGALTFAHEVGHNFGAAHDPITGGVLAYSYGQGYVNQAGDWGTIMAYDVACDDDANPGDPPYAAFCEIIPYFSNPDITYTDTSAPINSGPTGNATTADNARVHEERTLDVAAFRAEGTPPELAYSPNTLLQTLEGDATSTQTLTIQNTAGASSTPLNWSASLGNATGPSGSRTASGRWKISVDPLDEIPSAPTARLASGVVTDCIDGDQIAQTSANTPLAVSSGGTELGQSFTASCTGRLEKLAFGVSYDSAPNVAWDMTIRIYEGAGTGGTQLLFGSLSITNGPSGSAVLTLTLPTPVDLTQGEAYSFFIDLTSNNTGLLANTTGPYADGTMLETSNGDPASATAVPGSDLYFRLDLLAPTTPSITWVSLSPTTGTLDGGESVNVTVSFDATGLIDGVYTADLTLTTTDPDASSVTIPVQLTVTDLIAYAFNNGYGWRVLSPPGDATTVATLADQNLVQGVTGSYPAFDDNLYTAYSGTSDVWSPASSTTDALTSGRGFAWYLFDQTIDPDPGDPNNSASVELPMTLEAAGNEPSGDVDVSVHGDGFDLLGNPFTDALDVSDIATWTGSGNLTSVVGQVYRCTADSSPTVECVGSYETTSSLSNSVPVWHGVFFETGTAGTLTIPISAKGLPAIRTAPRLLTLELATSIGGAIDRAATLLFHNDATPAWDVWDAAKLAPLDNPSVTLAFEGDRDGETALKAQESRPYEPESFEVPLTVASEGAGSELVLTWPRIDGVPSDWTLTLTDRQTGETVDLRQLDAYAFTVAESAGREGIQPGTKLQRSAGAARFTLSVQTSKSVSTDTETESVLALDPPRPNPVSSQATVTYSLAEAGPVRLSVVDLLGREVSVLAEGARPAGPGLATWQPNGLAAGVYLVRLEAAGTVMTRRAVVTR